MDTLRLLFSVFLLATASWGVPSDNTTNVVTPSNGTVVSKCQKLGHLFHKRKLRQVSIFGKPRSVSVVHGARAPSRAAAALLVAVLRHALRYIDVRLRAGPRTLCELAGTYPDLHDKDEDYDELVVHVGAEWMKEEDQTCEALRRCDQRDMCGAAGPRFNVMGPPLAPMTLRLHARLSPAAWSDPACASADTWPFYANLSAVTHCGFKQDIPAGLQILDDIPTTVECSSSRLTCIPVLVPPDWNTTHVTAQNLVVRVNGSLLPLRIVPLPDDLTLRRLLNGPLESSSLLFMDYELWANARNSEMRVKRVQSPPPEIETVEALRVADAFSLKQYAPRILDAFRHLAIYPHELRDVLDREAKGLQIEEAACEHAYNNSKRFDIWSNTKDSKLWAYVMLCDDPDFNEYEKICTEVGNLMNLTPSLQVNIHPVKCSDENDLNQRFIDMIRDLRYVWNVGVVGAGAGAVASASLANISETQLVLYDVPPEATKLGTATRAVSGRLEQLVRATQHFLNRNSWKRIAVISESGSLARDFVYLLAKDSTLALRHTLISVDDEVAKVLQRLLQEDSRVLFINTSPDTASMILCEALRLGLTPDRGYAWIVREWRNSSCDLEAKGMRHFTVSYWWRGGDDSALETSGSALLRRKLDDMWPGRTWPMLAAPLADALILLDSFTNAGLRRYPSRRNDLHGFNATRDFAEAFSQSKPPMGVVQELRQSGSAQHAPLVFVDAWSGDQRRLLAVWRVSGTSVESLKELDGKTAESSPVWDGSRRFNTFCTGDAFSPTCHEGAVFVLAIVILLTPAALWLAARLRTARLEARDRALQVRLVARCERTAAALADHLVDRRALELHEELGVGHFGRVCRGTLKQAHGPPMPVAVKALRGDAAPAEEAEFLREACALAALGGAHVVRLVGVCATDGPPLLLMEHAFFGDLIKYLRERRHLAELSDGEEQAKTDTEQTEARHVSAIELTRLAREASAALAHVARARFVHRDVRAANCLIDDQRTLKLADFGMARATSSKASGEQRDSDGDEYLYICRRRGVFPVPWMAPESLQRGVFSPASDVWALGVLLLEVATLGARPFAAWRPPRVLRHVRAGGHPPLPRDATYHMCEIVEQCWQRAAEARPSAAEVLDYLWRHPAALRPALRPAWPHDGEDPPADSGFDERDPNVESDPHITTL